MSETLRLCSWNIQLGLQREIILDAIRREKDFVGLDLLALQEASTLGNKPDAELIAAALGPGYACYQVTAHHLGGRAQANALAWNTARLRVTEKERVHLPRAREVKLSRPEKAILRALPAQSRISLRVEGSFGAETLRVYVAHLDVVGFAHKRQQFYRMLDDARGRDPVDLTILAGDLNTFRIRSRPSWAELIDAAEAEGFHELTSEIRWTHSVPRIRLRQKLDAIFVGRSRPFHYRSWGLDIRGSDHIPVFADLILE